MALKHKPANIEELADHLLHASHEADFKKRVEAFELLHKGDNRYIPLVQEYARDIVFKNPTKDADGSYDIAYKHLDKLVKGHTDIVGESNIAEVLEKYVDGFLERVLKPEDLAAHRKIGERMPDKERRAMKGMLFGHYFRDEEGRPINILDEQQLKKLGEKTKIEIIQYLRESLGKDTVNKYTNFWISQATRDLIKQEDHGHFVPYIKEKMKEAGLEHPDEHYHATRDVPLLRQEYSLLLGGQLQPLLEKSGYKTTAQRSEDHGAAQHGAGAAPSAGHGGGHT